MAITSFDQYIGAYKQQIQLNKTNTITTVAGRESSLLDRAGFPTAAALAPTQTTNGVVPTDATTGFPAIASFQGSNKGYLSRVEAYSNVACTLMLFDLLFWAGGTAIPLSGTTTVALTSRPSFASRVPFDSGGVNRAWNETELWLHSNVAWSNHAHTASIDYTDQDNNAGANTGNISTQNRPVNSMMRMPWAAGDNGARDLEGYRVNGIASAAGQVTAMVLRRLWIGRLQANQQMVFGPDLTGMPEVFADSALFLAVNTDSTTSPTPNLRLEIAEG